MNTHFNGIGVENFRVFKDSQYFDFAPITILTGTNSSGKSSLINLLALLKETYKGNFMPLFLSQVGELFERNLDKDWTSNRIGDAEKLTHNRNNSNSIEVYLPVPKNSMAIHMKFELVDKEYILQQLEFKLLGKADYKEQEGVSLLKVTRKLNQVNKIEATEIELNLRYCYDALLNGEDSEDSKSFYYWLDNDSQLTNSVESLLKTIYKGGNTKINNRKFNEDLYFLYSCINWYRFHSNDFNLCQNVNMSLEGGFNLNTFQRQIIGFFRLSHKFESNKADEFIEKKMTDFGKHLLRGKKSEGLKWFNKLKPVLKFIFKSILEKQLNDVEEPQYKSKRSPMGLTIAAQEDLLNKAIEDFFQYFGVDFRTISNFDFIGNKRESINRNTSLSATDNITSLIKRFYYLPTIEQVRLLEFYKYWIAAFDIADNFKIDTIDGFYKLGFKVNETWVGLNDLGHGVTMLLPMILSVKLMYSDYETFKHTNESFKPQIIVIEEPDSNLHPALQSKLADFFMEAANEYNVQFIIETHSEYLIRKLQYLTAKGEIKPEDTQIYYFHPPDDVPEGEKQGYPININADGSLTKNFGTGFFDESVNIALELFLLKKEQTN